MILGAVTCHEQKQQHNDQIANVKILWQKLPQEIPDATADGRLALLAGLFLLLWWAGFLLWRRTVLLRFLMGSMLLPVGAVMPLRYGAAVVRDPVSAVGAIWLWNIAVIHGIT